MIETSLFPYSNFNVRLEQKDENRICWFRDDYDLQKHLQRHKLDKRTLKIFHRNDENLTNNSKNSNKKRTKK
jgi:hypothetical protein